MTSLEYTEKWIYLLENSIPNVCMMYVGIGPIQTVPLPSMSSAL